MTRHRIESPVELTDADRAVLAVTAAILDDIATSDCPRELAAACNGLAAALRSDDVFTTLMRTTATAVLRRLLEASHDAWDGDRLRRAAYSATTVGSVGRQTGGDTAGPFIDTVMHAVAAGIDTDRYANVAGLAVDRWRIWISLLWDQTATLHGFSSNERQTAWDNAWDAAHLLTSTE